MFTIDPCTRLFQKVSQLQIEQSFSLFLVQFMLQSHNIFSLKYYLEKSLDVVSRYLLVLLYSLSLGIHLLLPIHSSNSYFEQLNNTHMKMREEILKKLAQFFQLFVAFDFYHIHDARPWTVEYT